MNFTKQTAGNLTVEDILLTIQANPETMKELTIEQNQLYADIIAENNLIDLTQINERGTTA